MEKGDKLAAEKVEEYFIWYKSHILQPIWNKHVDFQTDQVDHRYWGNVR